MTVSWHPPELNPDLALGAYKDDDGKLQVWVNAAPDHPRHGGGWFEPYKGKPKDYRPSRPAEESEKGYLDFDAAEAQA